MPNSNEKNFVVIYLPLLSPFTIFVTYYEKDGGILMKHTIMNGALIENL